MNDTKLKILKKGKLNETITSSVRIYAFLLHNDTFNQSLVARPYVVSIGIFMAHSLAIIIYKRGKMKLHLHNKIKCTNCKGKGHIGGGKAFGYNYVISCDKCSGKGNYERTVPITMKNLKNLLKKV